mmetsp:Transcript_24052/g.32260  ORF Transcript_24052/g.32260 Transcript_24052/m.32260 type:complete len:249 (+) Transcript_24052:1089-1835(+)
MSFGVLRDIYGKTDGRAALARRVDSSWRNLVHILQELRLSSGGITAEEHVDLSAEATTATLRELFRDTTEQLAQDALLDVVALPDRGGKRVDEDLLHIFTLRESFEIFNLLLCKDDVILVKAGVGCRRLIVVSGGSVGCLLLLLLLHGDVLSALFPQLLLAQFEALLVALDIGYHVDISPVDVLQRSLVRVHSHAHRLVNAGNLDTVARPHVVHQVLIRAQVDRLRGFTLGDGLGGLLHLHVLLVRED